AYCEGTTLARWLKDQQAPVPPRDAAALVATLAEAVHYTHGRGVLHRDLKPSNILLQERNHETHERHEKKTGSDVASRSSGASWFTPRITDFGLAKLIEGGTDETRSGALLGTPLYMAPEQVEGRLRDVGPPTDVYALGVILYEMLTGRPPFPGENAAQVYQQV